MFAAPEWDDNLPETKFTSHNKNAKKKKKKGKQRKKDKVNLPTATAPAPTDNEPGKYVRINTNRAITLIDDSPLKHKKRKIKPGAANAKEWEHEKSDVTLPKKRRKMLLNHNVTNGDGGGKGGDGGGKGGGGGGAKKQCGGSGGQSSGSDLCGGKEVKLKRKSPGNSFVNQKPAMVLPNNSGDNSIKTPSEQTKSFRQTLIENLKGSRFRYLNEKMYSVEGHKAIQIFKDDPDAFQAYHEGYTQQVQQWPLNPLDRIIKSIKKLPKNYTIADFGCGEGRLAKSVYQKTYSLDLVAANDDIIACDMATTPLATNSINVVVFCLSLMGTNLKEFFLEANRVMKLGGLLKIAEVESRFADVKTFIENVQKCGFELVNKDLSNNLFYFINFKKIKNITKVTSNSIINFALKPCLYKKR